MTWKWITVGLVGLTVGCQENSKPMPRGLLGPDGRPLSSPVMPDTSRAAAKDAVGPKFHPLASPFDRVQGPAAAPAPPQAQAPAPEPAPAPERDLSSELARLLPAPAECLDLARASARGKVAISVTAMVMPSGRLSRASVSVPGQPAESLKCIEKRVLQGVLPPGVPKAPIQVEANLAVEVVAHGQPATAVEQPQKTTLPPMQPNVAQPENGEVAQPDGTEFAQPSQ